MMACAGIDLKCSGYASLSLSTDAGGSNSSDAGGSSVSDNSPIRDESRWTSCDGVSEQDGVLHRSSAQTLNSRMFALQQESLELMSYQRAGNEALPAGVAQGTVSVENLIESVQQLLTTMSDVAVADARAHAPHETEVPVGSSFLHALETTAKERNGAQQSPDPLMPQKVNTFCLGMATQAGLDGGSAKATPQLRQGGSKEKHQHAQSHEPQRKMSLSTKNKQRPNSAPQTPQMDQTSEQFRNEFVKTRLCCFELMGCCKKGTRCPFAHCAGDLRRCPDLTKTSICHKWTRGCCPLPAERCRYAHGASDRL
mmetsp:Transcript_38970/g.103562  ORF Transcript_38970/g.103562 Transcript_38970/m.103562 type:complete len:311 (-) Transcript_38970:1493-2425(-)